MIPTKRILKLVYFIYLFFLYYAYVSPVNSDIVFFVGILSDKVLHIIIFLFLGLLAQIANDRENSFVFGVSMAFITSVFIEFIHYILPYRDFEYSDCALNIIGCVSGIYLVTYLRKKYGKASN